LDSAADNFNLRFEPADYRVRMFLSVDLSGSTAFKNSDSGEDRLDGAAPKWVTVFQQFYTDFPAFFRTEYQQQTNGTVGNDGCPKLWKAVGDELVFCGKISNKKAGAVALSSFINTLHRYREILRASGVNLDLKGAGWLAAFPEPNRAVQLRRANGNPDLLSASEALEKCADESPFDYDFLGKAIDTGFRVAGSAKPEQFVLSVQLARLLANTTPGFGFDHAIRFDRPRSLKGVNRDEPYPILYIDTMIHLPTEEARKQERQLLGEDAAPDREQLAKYLEAYCKVVGTEEIMLPVDNNGKQTGLPESYSRHKEMIADHLSQEQGREFDGSGEDEAAQESDATDALEVDDLTPLSSDDD